MFMWVDDVTANVATYLIKELSRVNRVAEHVVDGMHSALVAETALFLEVQIDNFCSFHVI